MLLRAFVIALSAVARDQRPLRTLAWASLENASSRFDLVVELLEVVVVRVRVVVTRFRLFVLLPAVFRRFRRRVTEGGDEHAYAIASSRPSSRSWAGQQG